MRVSLIFIRVFILRTLRRDDEERQPGMMNCETEHNRLIGVWRRFSWLFYIRSPAIKVINNDCRPSSDHNTTFPSCSNTHHTVHTMKAVFAVCALLIVAALAQGKQKTTIMQQHTIPLGTYLIIISQYWLVRSRAPAQGPSGFWQNWWRIHRGLQICSQPFRV